MEEKKELNLVEILKDCPKGMKLWSPCWGVLTYNGIDWREYDAWDYESDDVYPIQTTWVEEELLFNPYGKYINSCDVMIYPSKDNRDWRTFRIPFKDGDFIYSESADKDIWISIFKEYLDDGQKTHADFSIRTGSIFTDSDVPFCESIDDEVAYQRLATDEEKQQLLEALNSKGYNWNNEAKKIEKIEKVEEDKPKWNPDTLQPFDKVLVRSNDDLFWDGDFYLYTNRETGSDYPYSCVSSNYKICIPYNDETKHLLGTNQEAPESYRL